MSDVEAARGNAAREGRLAVNGSQPRWWDRANTLWLAAAALILPFGWLLPLAHFARVQVKARRERKG